MPSKKIYVKPYKVKAHHRIIHTRTFKFICAHCETEARRITFATVCPKYCDNCKDIKNKLGKKKHPSGEVIDSPTNKLKNTTKNSRSKSTTSSSRKSSTNKSLSSNNRKQSTATRKTAKR